MESLRQTEQMHGGDLCAPCRLVEPPFIRASAYGVYQSELRSAVHLLKYEKVTAIAKPLGRKLAEAIQPLCDEADTEMLMIAVPLFPAKERQRGFNQSVLLAEAAMKHLSGMVAGHRAMTRKRDTDSQFLLQPHKRRENLKGAFLVQDKGLIAGRTILLVDDVYTTGATARECSKTLLDAGAARVFVATLGRAQAETFTLWKQKRANFVH